MCCFQSWWLHLISAGFLWNIFIFRHSGCSSSLIEHQILHALHLPASASLIPRIQSSDMIQMTFIVADCEPFKSKLISSNATFCALGFVIFWDRLRIYTYTYPTTVIRVSSFMKILRLLCETYFKAYLHILNKSPVKVLQLTNFQTHLWLQEAFESALEKYPEERARVTTQTERMFQNHIRWGGLSESSLFMPTVISYQGSTLVDLEGFCNYATHANCSLNWNHESLSSFLLLSKHGETCYHEMCRVRPYPLFGVLICGTGEHGRYMLRLYCTRSFERASE